MVTRLVADRPKLSEGSPRLWLVFFSDCRSAWWARLCRPGFRHVSAAAFYADRQTWVYYDPAARGTWIEIYDADEFGGRLAALMGGATAVLRVQSRFERRATPVLWHCVGAVKALLGVRSCALGPWGLYLHLRAIGAEAVEVPSRVISRIDAAAAAGRPGGEGVAAAGAATG